MRSLIKTQKLNGKLTVGGKHIFENVRGEYQYDVFSNNRMEGTFEVPFLSASFHNDFDSNDSFTFIGNGFSAKGGINGWSLFGSPNTIDFDINDITSHIAWEGGEKVKMEISYFIPYVTKLARKIRTNRDLEEEFIIKYTSDEFKLFVNNTEIAFQEFVSFVKYEKPDSIFRRTLFPILTVILEKDENIQDKLKEYKGIFEQVMLVLSLIFFHRLNCFGYEANIYDEKNKLIDKIEHRFTKKKSGVDCFLEDKLEFNNYFTTENVSKIVDSFISLDDDSKNKYKRIIHSYLTIKELDIFEPKFKDTYYALEAISKIIVNPMTRISSEKLIANACEIALIDIASFDFLPSNNSNELKWLISEYRNDLTHFNFNINFDHSRLINERNKMMRLLRSLMIYFLVPELKEFPFPGKNLE